MPSHAHSLDNDTARQAETPGQATPARQSVGPHADVLALQRKAGNRAVSGALRGGSSIDCTAISGDVIGEKFLFVVNTDHFKPGEAERLRMFATSVKPGEILTIHGYASEEGPVALNDNLSCLRANKAVTEILASGVQREQIRKVFKHGATPGERSQRRSVLVEKETRGTERIEELEPEPLTVTPVETPSETENTSLQVPEFKVKREWKLPEEPLPPIGPVLGFVTGKVGIEGSIRCGQPSTSISFSEQKLDVDLPVGEDLKDWKVKVSLEPDGLAKVGVEWKGQDAFLGRPLTLSFSLTPTGWVMGGKTPIFVYDSYEDSNFSVYGCRFKGKVEMGADVQMLPNPAFPGWGAAARGLTGLVLTETGTLTALGATGLATAAAGATIGWVGFGLYQIGGAQDKGKRRAVGAKFAEGFAEGLIEWAEFHGSEREELLNLAPDRILQAAYVGLSQGDRSSWTNEVEKAGRAAATQAVERYITKYGKEAWLTRAAKLFVPYGGRMSDQRRAFFDMLIQQVNAGSPIGIALE